MTKSSAQSKELMSKFPNLTGSQDRSKISGNLFIKRLNKSGDKPQPCLTPIVVKIGCNNPLDNRIWTS